MPSRFTAGRALLVGAGGDLPNTVDDANGLAAILTDAERCAYDTEHVTVLTSEQARRGDILAAFDALAESTTPASTVLVYFSGHGYQVDSGAGRQHYLMPYGYDTAALPATAISGSEFAACLAALQAQKVLVMLDCCHAGGIGEAKTASLQLTKAPLPAEAEALFGKGSGRVVIASSRADELSFAGKPYSAFTLAVIEALCGTGAAKKDGYVRWSDVALHAREMVPQRTGRRQHPIVDLDEADNFVLAYYAAGGVEAKALPFAAPEIEPEPGAFRVSVQGSGPVVGSAIVSGGFFQPGMTVNGPVLQAAGDINVAAPAGTPIALAALVDELKRSVNALSVTPLDRQRAQHAIEGARLELDAAAGAIDTAALAQHLQRLVSLAKSSPSAEAAQVLSLVARLVKLAEG